MSLDERKERQKKIEIEQLGSEERESPGAPAKSGEATDRRTQ
jgi:hypothetical protein